MKHFKISRKGTEEEPIYGGIIINIGATLHYTATWYQIYVSHITRSLSLEWGTDYDIRVNGIAPDPLMTLLKWDIAMAAMYLASKSLSM
ncbi:hypothetical protein AAG906_000722 [Vitis piasezkii]